MDGTLKAISGVATFILSLIIIDLGVFILAAASIVFSVPVLVVTVLGFDFLKQA